MPVSFRSELFTSYILTIFKHWNLLSKYEKLPNIVIHACKNITEKNEFVENVTPANSALFFTFRPIPSKQLNGLTTIDILSWLDVAVITHPLCVQEVPGSIPGSGKGFNVWFVDVVFLPFVKKHIICHKKNAIPFVMFIYLVY